MGKTYGQIVRTRRRELGFTLEDIAGQIGIVKGYLSGIETGAVAPPAPEVTEELAATLRLDVKRLLMLAHAEKAPKQVRHAFVRFVMQRIGAKQYS